MKFPIMDFFSKCDQIRSFLRIWSHLLKKFLMENFPFCTMRITLEYNKKLICCFIVLVRNRLQISPLTLTHFSPVSYFYTTCDTGLKWVTQI